MKSIVRKERVHECTIHSYTLKIGAWRQLFAPEECKLIMAEAMNATLNSGEFRLALTGYLFTDYRACIILQTEHRKIRLFFDMFYDCIRSGIRHHVDKISKPGMKKKLLEELNSHDDLFENLFREHPLKDEHLIALITGRSVELPYSDPQLERLKEKIRNHRYCSAVDYLGAQSPVNVRLLKPEAFEENTGSHKHRN
jgi:hypothetical protein